MSRITVTSRDVESGETVVHQAGHAAGYHTLCGVSLNDDLFIEESTPRRAKINCQHCRSIWETARHLRSSDFTKDTP